MTTVLNEIFGQLVTRFIGEVEFLFGALMGLGFWSMDHAVIELRARRLAFALGCAAVGAILIAIALLAARDAGALMRITVAGFLLYLPLRIGLRRHLARARRD